MTSDLSTYSTLRQLYLEGHGDFVSGLISTITRVTKWVIGVLTLLTKSPKISGPHSQVFQG